MGYSPLDDMILTDATCKLKRALCVWSDLLGFGSPFQQANWRPSAEVWKAQAARVGAAYRTHCRHLGGGLNGAFALLLNDGVVRTVRLHDEVQADEIGMWLTAAITAHHWVRADEAKLGLPGPRTVISSGWSAEHSFESVHIDDLVLNYTRSREGLSRLAEMTGNPLVALNPAALQLNTAFSRAYLLDGAGGKHGLGGPNVFVDAQLLDDMREHFASDPRVAVVEWVRANDRVFALERIAQRFERADPSTLLTIDAWKEIEKSLVIDGVLRLNDPPDRRLHFAFGFLLDREPIPVELPNLKTSVHRVLGFFPHDEDPRHFVFEL